jgi:hypothetical protein
MNNLIFICGHRKSGTTVFHNLFDGHPDLVVYPSDLNLLYAYFPIYLSGEYSDEVCKKRLVKVLFSDLKQQLTANNIPIILDMDLYQELFFQKLNGEFLNIKKIIESLAQAFLSVIGKESAKLVLKETSIEIYMQEILEWFPDAKILHLIRDPRDNYASLKSGVSKYYSKLGENEKETLASLIFRTRIGMKMGLLNKALFGEGKYKFVKYEDLIEKTMKTMQDVALFLDIPFTDVLCSPTRLGSTVIGNNFEGEIFSKVDNKNVGRWSERIHKEEAMIIEFNLSEFMSLFQYDLEYLPVESGRAAAGFYKWENYRFFFKDRFVE